MVYEEDQSTNVVEVLTEDGEVRRHLRHKQTYSTTVYQYKPQLRDASERTYESGRKVVEESAPRLSGDPTGLYFHGELDIAGDVAPVVGPRRREEAFIIVQDHDYIASAPAGGDSDQSHCIATRIS